MKSSRFLARRPSIPLLLLLGALSACANNRVFVNLDMASFMSPEDRSFAYLLPGLVPGESFADTSGVSEIEVPEGINNVLDLQEMSLDLRMTLDTTEIVGQVAMTYRIEVYVAARVEPAELWREENKLVALNGPIVGGTVTTIGEDGIDVSRFIDLFKQNETIYLGSVLGIRHDSGIGLIDGTGEITRLALHIVSRTDLF